MGNKIIPKTALISVSDKKGLLPFARSLKKFGVQIVATGGTAKALKKGGIGVKKISTITKFPEIFGGRVKTLNPLISGGGQESGLRAGTENISSIAGMALALEIAHNTYDENKNLIGISM